MVAPVWHTAMFVAQKLLPATVLAAVAVVLFLSTSKESVPRPGGGDDESVSLPSRLRRQMAKTLAVERELTRISELILRDFVEYWYDDLSDSQDFSHNIRWTLEQVILLSMSRILRVDWPQLILEKVIPSFHNLLAIYDAAATPSNLDNLSRLRPGDPKRVERITEILSKRHTFHVGLTQQEPYLRDFATALIGGLFQPQDFGCDAFRSLIREILTCRVLSAVLGYANPYWMNYGLWCLPDLKNRPKPDDPPYYGPGYARTERQIEADDILDTRLQTWNEAKEQRMHAMEQLVEGTFMLNADSELDLDAMWSVRIEGTQLLFDPKPFVVYELRVENGDYQWRLVKRYSDFKQLHARLKRSYPNFSVKLPGRTYVFQDNMNQKFIQRRREGLQAFLQQLIWDRHAADSQIFREFLVDRRQNIRATRKGHRHSIIGKSTKLSSVKKVSQGVSQGGPPVTGLKHSASATGALSDKKTLRSNNKPANAASLPTSPLQATKNKGHKKSSSFFSTPHSLFKRNKTKAKGTSASGETPATAIRYSRLGTNFLFFAPRRMACRALCRANPCFIFVF